MSRKDYCIKPSIKCGFEKDIVSLFPTIIFQPWQYRYINSCIVEFWWITFYVCIGIWENKE